MMELLYLAGSPFSRIPRILILEWQLDIETREVPFPVPADVEDVNPLGQAPVLLRPPDEPLFLTLNIIEELASVAGPDQPFPYRAEDRANTAIALSAGDSLIAAAQAQWSGLGPVSENRLGWNPMDRNPIRFNRTMAWLAERTSPDSFVALVAASLMYWAKDRPVEGIITDGKAAQHFLGLTARPSFEATKPRPHVNRSSD